MSPTDLGKVAKRLAQRWFLVRDAHAKTGTVLMQPRWAMSFMRGPMTRNEIRRALRGADAAEDEDTVTPPPVTHTATTKAHEED